MLNIIKFSVLIIMREEAGNGEKLLVKFGPSSQLILFTFCENEVLAVVVAGMMVVTVVVVGEVSRSLFGMSRRSGYCVVS